jgi:hypothetical protein
VGCPAGGCESTPQPLVPFPFSGLDPTNQVPVPAPSRVLAFFPFGAGQEAPFPPADPAPVSLAPVGPTASVCAAALPVPSISSVTPASGVQSTSAVVTIAGNNLVPGASCSFGAGILAACNVTSPTAATALLSINSAAAPGPRSVVLTNPDGQAATVPAGFTVIGTPPPTQPVLVAVTPASALQGGSGTIALTGTGFVPGAGCSFGAGISAACNVISSTSATAVIAVTPGAAVGPRDVVFTDPNNLSATLLGGFAVTAAPPPPPPGAVAPTALLTASSNAVSPGGSSTLTFATTNATAVTITPIGSFGANGTVVVSPSVTTTYTLTATGPGGTTTSSTLVVVTAPPAAAPTALLTASTATVPPGGSSTLTFATTGATAVTIAPIGSFGANGTVVVSPAVTTTYTLTATGPGGSAASSVTVAVAAPPGGPLFADPFTRSGALGPLWSVVQGNFTLDGTSASASGASRNEAAVAGLSVANGKVQVVLTLSAGGTAGARLRRTVAQSSGYAVSAASNGIILVQRISGGVASILKGANTGVAAGQTHTLAMTVTGTSPVVIQVDLDGAPLMTVNDTAPTRITAPGTVSIEGNLGSRWDDIQVF